MFFLGGGGWVENWELPQFQTETKGQEESQQVRVTVPAFITLQDVDLPASHSTQKPFLHSPGSCFWGIRPR